MNKSAVFYKAGDIEKEEENEYGENSESRNYDGKPRKEFVLMILKRRHLIIAHLNIGIVSRVIKKILSKFLRYLMRNPLHL